MGDTSYQPIPYTRQSIEDDDIRAVTSVLESGRLTQGPLVDRFEQALAEVCDVPFAVAFSSGTAALHACAAAASLGHDDELLTAGITFAASANCGAYVGATPRFADVDEVTGNVTAASVLAAVTDRTRAVVPVHLTGLPAPVAEIRRALGDDVVIIEDAAHALGACDDEGPIGACRSSDLTIFSFHPAKAITTAEGGAVTTRDPALNERLRAFRTHGFAADATSRPGAEGGWWYEQDALGFNYRLSDVHAALGVSQLGKLERFIGRRRQVADRYDEALAGLGGIRLPARPMAGQSHAFHLYAIQLEEGSEARKDLYDHLIREGILAQVHYIPVYRHPYYRRTFGYEELRLPGAEAYYSRCLSIPCYPSLEPADQDRVVTAIKSWHGS